MMEKPMKLMEAVEKVLTNDQKTRRPEYNWLFLAKTLREMGFKIFIEFDRRMPSPETLFRERREIINKRNKFASEYIPEDNVTIVKKEKKDVQT